MRRRKPAGEMGLATRDGVHSEGSTSFSTKASHTVLSLLGPRPASYVTYFVTICPLLLIVRFRTAFFWNLRPLRTVHSKIPFGELRNTRSTMGLSQISSLEALPEEVYTKYHNSQRECHSPKEFEINRYHDLVIIRIEVEELASAYALSTHQLCNS